MYWSSVLPGSGRWQKDHQQVLIAVTSGFFVFVKRRITVASRELCSKILDGALMHQLLVIVGLHILRNVIPLPWRLRRGQVSSYVHIFHLLWCGFQRRFDDILRVTRHWWSSNGSKRILYHRWVRGVLKGSLGLNRYPTFSHPLVFTFHAKTAAISAIIKVNGASLFYKPLVAASESKSFAIWASTVFPILSSSSKYSITCSTMVGTTNRM